MKRNIHIVLWSGAALFLLLALGGSADGPREAKPPRLSLDRTGSGMTFRLRLSCETNGVVYLIQSSTNLTRWQTLLSVKSKVAERTSLGEITASNQMSFYRVLRFDGEGDTNAPGWSNGPNGQFKISLPSTVAASWDAATDNVAVAEYRLYLNGGLFTNVLGNVLAQEFTVDLRQRSDIRIQAVDASGNASEVLSLAYLPGDKLLAVGDENGRVFLFQVQADGAFGAPRQIIDYGSPDWGVGLGDFDRDGILDLISGNSRNNTLSPFFRRGKGDGTFGAGVALPTAPGSRDYMMPVTVADFDCDGNLDFAANGDGPVVFFYWGRGDGTFDVDARTWAGDHGRGMAAGDFDEDGRLDLVRATCCNGYLRMFLSNGDRTFTETNLVGDVGDNPYGVVAGDFDEDGHLDIIANAGGSGDVFYFKGYGNGSFTNLGVNGVWANLDPDDYAAMATGDYNGDGHLDLLMCTYNTRSVYFWAGNGDGTFGTNRLTLVTGIGRSLGIGAPPLPPRLDLSIAPIDLVTNLNRSILFQAQGAGILTNDWFRWTFGDEGTNPLSWNFTASMTNMGPAFAHAYTNEGRFVTRLWHTGSNNIQSVRGTWVTVRGAPPVADPGGPYTLGEGAVTQAVWYATLNGSGSRDDFGVVSYIWSFGDGLVVTNGPVVTHGWSTSGVWTVGLKVVDAGGLWDSNTATVSFAPAAPPVASISGPDVLDESSATNGVWYATFYATNSTDDFGVWKYAWSFGNGQTASGPVAKTTYNATGDYVVILTVTDHAGQTGVTTQAVTVRASGMPSPIIGGPRLLTEAVATNGLWHGAWDGLASTDDRGVYRYEWSFGDGGTASGAKVEHQYSGVGVYRLALTVYDHGNQSVTATQNVIVVAGSVPAARIAVSRLDPEGAEPVVLDATGSTDDYGIYSYRWLMPPRQFDFNGEYLDTREWRSIKTVQDGRLLVTGQNDWGHTFFFTIFSQVQRGGFMQGRVDTPSPSDTHAMVGFKSWDASSGHYNRLVYGLYFDNGTLRVYEYGNHRGKVGTYDRGSSYDFRIETKPGAGARYFIRPSGGSEAFAKVYESDNYGDEVMGFGADVHSGVFGFDDLIVDKVFYTRPTVTSPVFQGGTVTLQVVDHAMQTNSTTVTVTPVSGTAPVAVLNGPTNGPAGVELAFNAYGSLDDHAIASYTWDYGDGSAAEFGPAVAHRYGVPGIYTNVLSAMDYAGQVTTATQVVVVAEGNALVCVPWRILNGVEQPHETYSGKTVTLKAVARNLPLPFTNIWDFGDGSEPVTNSVTTPEAALGLEARHAYTGSAGTPFYAIARVILSDGMALSDTYPILLRPKTLDTEMKVAIDEGLWFLHKSQTRYDIDDTHKGGYWVCTSYGTYYICSSASAVQAFAINGHLMTDDASQDPYVETVQRGVNYLLTTITYAQIGLQTYGDPDSNHNGLGLYAGSDRPIYETGPMMDALIAAGRPELVAQVGGLNVKGRTFQEILADMVDAYAWGQYDHAEVGGGWRYGWNEWPDNSASQWGAIGLMVADRIWGISAPDWVKERNKVWVNYSRGGSGFGYTGGGDGEATTPSGLVQLAFDGVPTTNALWQHGERYLANNWNWLMSLNNLYANYAIVKALRSALPQPVQKFSATGLDWFYDPATGLARVSIDRQAGDGSWLGSGRGYERDYRLSTAWSVIMLTSSLFQRGPVAVAYVRPNPAAMNYPVVFDARGSFHQHPSYKVVEYRWDFDAANGVDFDHPDALGAVVTNYFGALGTNTVTLQVRDNATPQLSDTAFVDVRITIPPYPPTADAGGPYVAAVGQDVFLDGSGSFDVDAASGDFIQSYDWEIDFEMPLGFNDATGRLATIAGGFPTAGQHRVGLRVKDATSIVFPQAGSPDLTGEDFTTVYVYERVIPDLRGRPKDQKVQLTWTKAGDYVVVMRSRLGPNQGFEEVGRTDSRFSTFLDTNIVFNADYYYRLLAYQNGRSDPIGISDAEFVVSRQRSFEDQPPAFVSEPVRLARVGVFYEVALDAKDPENDAIAFNMLAGPTNMTVNPTNGLVRFLPSANQIGGHDVSFEATNAAGRDVLSFTLFVFPATNQPPVANANGPYEGLTEQPIAFSSSGSSDPDGNALYYAWNFGDGSISTNPNPIHTYGGAGDYLVTLFVNDGYGGTATARTHAHVARPNRPPVAALVNGPNFAVRLGEVLTLDATGSYDLDGDPLTYAWQWGDGAQAASDEATGAHLYVNTGDYSGRLIISDGRGGEGIAPFAVHVAPSNQPPRVVLLLSTNRPFVMTELILDASASSDPEGDPMSFAWDFGDRTRTTGPMVTHVYRQMTNYVITLTVRDSHGGTAVATQLVEAINAPPVFTSTPPLMARANKPYGYTPGISDVDGDASTFQLVRGPATMSCDTDTGTLSWLPGTNDVGSYSIMLRATDENGGVTDQSFDLVVTEPLGLEIDLLPTLFVTTNARVDSQTLALSGTVLAYFENQGADEVPVPFTASVFVDVDMDGVFTPGTDPVVGWASFPEGFGAGVQWGAEMTVTGQALFMDCPLYVFVDGENVVPEYDEANNIRRVGFNADTNKPPVVDLSASLLRVDRSGLPAQVRLTARLGNSGLVPVNTNVPFAFYDGNPASGGVSIGVAHSTSVLAPGAYQDLAVVWEGPALTKHAIYVVADDSGDGTGLYEEIREGNNVFHDEVDLARNLAPLADAGPAQTVQVGDIVVLNGRASSDPEGKALSYRWSMLSVPVGSQVVMNGTNTVEPWFKTSVTGQYLAQLIVNDGLQDSTNTATVAITAVDTNANQAPAIVSTPSFQGMANVLYTYQVQARDPDGDPVAFRLTQAPASMTIHPMSGLLEWLPTDQGVSLIQIEAADGRGGICRQSYSLTVVPYNNLAPRFTSTPVTTVEPNALYRYVAVAVDPNHDPVTYALAQKPTGMSIDSSSGTILWTPSAAQIGGNLVTVTASDGHGGQSSQSYNLVVLNAGLGSPAVSSLADQTVTDPAAFTALPLDNYVTDPRFADDRIAWTVSGSTVLTVTIDSNRVATIAYPSGANVSERLTFLAANPDGKSAYASALFTVRSTDHPPVAAIANLSETDTTSIETGFFEVKGAADDSDPTDAVAYRLVLYDADMTRVADVTPKPVNAAGWHEGRVPSGGSLGILDFTLVRNGAYTLMLEVRGGSRLATWSGPIALNSELKVGQIGFSQQDLVLPVRGAGMRVVRAYDSLNLKAGDFGYGWTCSVSDLGVSINEQRAVAEDVLTGERFSLRTGGSWDVTLDMPDTGRRVTFRFRLDTGGMYKARAMWVPPAGVNASLVPTCSPYLIALTRALPPYWEAAGIDTAWENFDFPGFILTTQDGARYEIARSNLGEHYIEGNGTAYGNFVRAYDGGFLARIIQPTGERTEFVREGAALKNIEEYDASSQKLRSLLFRRDAQKRIKAIYAPENLDANGNPVGPAAVAYDYDAAGNLVKVSKLTGAADPTALTYSTIAFVYGNPRYPHYITEIKDSQGLSPVRMEYDNRGRLVATIDAQGNRTEVKHDLEARTETIYDRRGYAWTHLYDERGNIVASTDPLGSTATRSYDANNRLVSSVDPLGGTVKYAYDQAGRLLAVTNQLGHATRYTYVSNAVIATDPLGHQSVRTYDGLGNVLAQIDPMGRKTMSQYDAVGNPIALLDARSNAVCRMSFNAGGNPAFVSNQIGGVTSYTYDSRGRPASNSREWVNPTNAADVRTVVMQVAFDEADNPIRSVDGFGNATSNIYDDNGKLVERRQTRGGTTRYTYDSLGRQIEAAYPDGNVIQCVYDSDNRLLLSTEPHRPGELAAAEARVYDPVGRLVSVQRLRNVAVTIVRQGDVVRSALAAGGSLVASNATVYDRAGRVVRNFDPARGETRYEYDLAGQVTAVVNPNGKRREYEYDAAGKCSLARDEAGRELRYLYEADGRQSRVVYPDGSSALASYDENGRMAGVVDPGGNERRFVYSASGRLQSVILPSVADPENLSTLTKPAYSFSYDDYGSLIGVRDPKGRETRFVYDEHRRLVSRTLPLGQVEQRSYYAHGALWKIVDPKGQVRELMYDDQSRLIAKQMYARGSNVPSSRIEYAYDERGRKQRAAGDSGAAEYEYNQEGQVIRVSSPEGTIHYAYDGTTGLKTRTWTEHSEIRYSYDGLGRLETVCVHKRNGVTLPQIETTRYSYTAAGSRQTALLPNGTRTDYEYDDLNRLVALKHWNSSNSLLSSFHYQLGLDGRRIGSSEVQRQSDGLYLTNRYAYQYDGNNRLAREDAEMGAPTNSYRIAYTYDLAGNRLSRTVAAGNRTLTTTYRYDDNDRLLMESNSVATAGAMAPPAARWPGVPVRPSVWFRYAPWCLAGGLLLCALLPLAWGAAMPKRPRFHPAGGVALADAVLGCAGAPSRLARAVACLIVGIFGLVPTYAQMEVIVIRAALAPISTDLWSRGNTLVTYEYDANGSMIRKSETGPAGSVQEFAYNLENRLTSAVVTSEQGGHAIVVTNLYAYNADGIKVRSQSWTVVDDKIQSSRTNLYVLDMFNGTGHAQVIEQLPAAGASPEVSYVIGDDVIGQARAGAAANMECFLRDAHGSTRQLLGASGGLVESYAYDAFGAMTERTPSSASPARTSMLYSGEHYDDALQSYYLRSRNYNPLNGRFDRMDSFAGLPYDPQSYHKYAYVNNDPLNLSDPEGMGPLLEIVVSVMIKSLLVALVPFAAMTFSKDVRNFIGALMPDALAVGIVGSMSAGAWLTIAGLLNLSLVFPTYGHVTGGVELLLSVATGEKALWSYTGIGVNMLPAKPGKTSISGSLYVGTVWNLWNARDYAGAFTSVSVGAFGFFCDPGRGFYGPWGISVGQSLGKTPSASADMTDYKLISRESYHNQWGVVPDIALLAVAAELILEFRELVAAGASLTVAAATLAGWWGLLAAANWVKSKELTNDQLYMRRHDDRAGHPNWQGANPMAFILGMPSIDPPPHG